MAIITKIDEYRRKRGMSKDCLEKRAGLSAGRMCKWVAGQGSPTTDQVLRIAEVLGIHPMELMTNRTTPGLNCEFWRPMSPEQRHEIMGVCERMGYTEVMHRLLSPDASESQPRRNVRGPGRPSTRTSRAV